MKNNLSKFDVLDVWATTWKVTRTIYVGDKGIPPNNHCYWDKSAFSGSGAWVETDEHMRQRIEKQIRR